MGFGRSIRNVAKKAGRSVKSGYKKYRRAVKAVNKAAWKTVSVSGHLISKATGGVVPDPWTPEGRKGIAVAAVNVVVGGVTGGPAGAIMAGAKTLHGNYQMKRAEDQLERSMRHARPRPRPRSEDDYAGVLSFGNEVPGAAAGTATSPTETPSLLPWIVGGIVLWKIA
jgi:hypothetical protein